MNKDDILQGLYKICNILRDEGIGYTEYMNELSLMLCIKYLSKNELYKDCELQSVAKKTWDDLLSIEFYIGKQCLYEYEMILKLFCIGCASRRLQECFGDARTVLGVPKHLEEMLRLVDKIDCTNSEEACYIYEKFLGRAMFEKKFYVSITPKSLISVLVELISPQKGETSNDPACGDFSFMINSYDYIMKNNVMLNQTDKLEISNNFSGTTTSRNTFKLAIVNALLHGMIVDNIYNENYFLNERIFSETYDVVVSRPPMGRINLSHSYSSQLPFTSSNATINYLFRIYNSLKVREDEEGRAAVIVPDGILFSKENAAVWVKRDLMDKCNLHTILRLPAGIFYETSVVTNVLFFNRGRNNTGNTKEIYYYDLRTDMPSFSRANPITKEHFRNFKIAYQSKNRKEVQDNRWSCYTREEIRRYGENLDLGLMKKKVELDCEDNINVFEYGQLIAQQLKDAAELIEDVVRELS